MMSTRSPSEAAEWTLVRLSFVPLDKRLKAADKVIKTEGLVGEAALEMMLAAFEPKEDPDLLVPSELARKVLR